MRGVGGFLGQSFLAGNEVQRWEISLGGGTSTSAKSWGAYVDGNDASDPCSSQGLGLGVGYPHNIDNGLDPNRPTVTVFTAVHAERGTEIPSPSSANFQATSNDCNLVGDTREYPTRGHPIKSDCMDLNKP